MPEHDFPEAAAGINRIRLEFKDNDAEKMIMSGKRINRIRLEFKVDRYINFCRRAVVLIESDWNLKTFRSTLSASTSSINRIRLEFKVIQTIIQQLKIFRINRIRLEFKV